MRLYHNTSFPGHYPVGTAAVIVARDRAQAKRLLMEEAKKYGLKLADDDVDVKDFILMDTGVPACIILHDGNY